MYNERSDTITTAPTHNKAKHVIDIVVENGKMSHLQIQRPELSQFVEPFLRGQDIQAAPQVITQVQGLCSPFCQLATVVALEKIMGVTVSAEIRALRNLLNCAAWIENHAFHIYLRHAPKLLGYDSVAEMTGTPSLELIIERGLRLKRIGRALLKTIGRADKYLNWLCVGGFYQIPHRQELLAFRNELMWGLEAALQTVNWTADFSLPDFSSEGDFFAFHHLNEYPMFEGQTIASTQANILPEDFNGNLTNKNGYKNDKGNSHPPVSWQKKHYWVGPLARLNLNFSNLAPYAKQALAESRLDLPNNNPFTSIIARSIELVHAIEEARRIIENYVQPSPSRVAITVQAGEGSYLFETPYGLLNHYYCVNEYGAIQKADIVTPIAVNLRQIEHDLRDYLPPLLDLPIVEILRRCQQLIYCYEPGISKIPPVLNFQTKNGHF